MPNEPKIGHTIAEPANAERDAIHIAVAPVVANEELRPGEHVGLIEDGNIHTVSSSAATLIGIVDPYLDQVVMPGDKFWLFLYPQTITSLRHNWTHPAFTMDAMQASEKRVKESELWLRDFLDGNGPDYNDLMHALDNDGEADRNGYDYVRIDEDYLTVGGTDAHGSIPEEFWKHVEIVTGKKQKNKPTAFSCSC